MVNEKKRGFFGVCLQVMNIWWTYTLFRRFPGGLDGKEFAHNAGDPGSVPGLGRSPGEGHGNPLQYSCLENPMNRGARWATVHGVAKSRTGLSDFTFTHFTREKELWHQPVLAVVREASLTDYELHIVLAPSASSLLSRLPRHFFCREHPIWRLFHLKKGEGLSVNEKL